RRRYFLQGQSIAGSGLPDVWWFRTDGRQMTRGDWQDGGRRTLGGFLNGDELHETTSRGEAIADESVLLLFNSGSDTVVFTLPARRFGARWKLELSTAAPHAEETSVAAREEVALEPHSLLVLRRGW